MKVISSSLRAVGSGPTVVLLHSSGSSGRQWEALSTRMRARYRVVTVDVHGHGTTPEWPSDRPLRLEDDMALTAPLFGAAGPIHLVGHSYGGVLALKLALKHSSHVASVAVFEPVWLRLLVDFNPRERAALSITRAAQSICEWHAQGQPMRAAERFVDFWSGPGTWSAMPPKAQTAVACRVPAVLGHFGAIFADSTRQTDLARLKMPVLCVTGTKTTEVARRIGELMQHWMPHATFEELSGAGHMGPITHADAFAARIERFIGAQSASANDGVALQRAA